MDDSTTSNEIWPVKYTGLSYGLLVINCSAVLFYLIGRVAAACISESAKHAPWRWKNTIVSFTHACISGSWSIMCFYETPKLAEDMITTYSSFSYTLISFSVGYFVYDVVDMLLYQRTRQSLELLGHHAVLLMCYMVAITTHMYVGYAVVGLIVEVNSIFLHLRQILQIQGFQKDNSFYRMNSLINLGTFIVCRITLLAWMTRWIVINKDHVPLLFYTMGSVGLAVLTLMNIILFYRVLMSDFVRKKDTRSKNE
ncbi:TLC domain-containing protein 2-like [Haliotis rufescens]|uniref:TLC domain-containing protein 2-like n=1 Tax=Haliotis rufescens TaxID=6454 RepID=UPI00201F5AD3|nr:TLC domain-containing protein 2-like [Haliotis rufescens]XP_048252463.1 TLC domain-containing protein 2-like [Haliotis rufescens]XP_048252464.1 TLC domain-containing protein 2-like [Haliotis rufescens]XP_048252465.1 TLC domain-containing protein 2-like [Haliotis rufescens]XP_048252466.1 TLC domain-containing protein 2-like [Haliotis rufescens]XP_048252467.1 TLC domain-containing protein 2-like [Haliotis rufescens]XP_048252468.1 TLC domain-containing protein 2-like [Haliotis rufescens]XP_0